MATFAIVHPDISILKGIHPGFVIERELKERGLSPEAFAEMIGENSYDIDRIIAGGNRMQESFACKMEQVLDFEAGILMKLQAVYDTKEEKRLEGQSAHPDLSLLRPVLFWDTNIHKIDWKQQKRAVIRRVFERGDEQEKEEIRRFYGEEEVTAALSGSKRG